MKKEKEAQEQSALLSNFSWARAEGWAEVRARHQSLHQWMEKNEKTVRSLVKSLGGGIDMDPEDLFQEAALAICQAWDHFDVNRFDILRISFLKVVVRNHLGKLRRAQNASTRKPQEKGGMATETLIQAVKNLPAADEPMECVVETRLLEQALVAALRTMPPLHQTAFRMCVLEERSSQDVADFLELKEHAVWNMVYEVRSTLRLALDAWKKGERLERVLMDRKIQGSEERAAKKAAKAAKTQETPEIAKAQETLPEQPKPTKGKGKKAAKAPEAQETLPEEPKPTKGKGKKAAKAQETQEAQAEEPKASAEQPKPTKGKGKKATRAQEAPKAQEAPAEQPKSTKGKGKKVAKAPEAQETLTEEPKPTKGKGKKAAKTPEAQKSPAEQPKPPRIYRKPRTPEEEQAELDAAWEAVMEVIRANEASRGKNPKQ